jgi:hypothetical protein
MKKFAVFMLLSLGVAGINSVSAQLPELTKKEIRQGWVLLFDGHSSNGWQKANGDPFPATGWNIENGVLSVNPLEGGGGDIVTKNKYADFELSLEFRVSKGANSGIKYFIFEGSSLGLEFQILDDKNHPDAIDGKNGNRLQGSLYDLIPPAKNKKDMPLGEWNQARIISNGAKVEHWLNGQKILEFVRGSDEFRQLVAESKYKNRPGFGEIEKSPILLQDHGDVISFRNIKIRKL